MAGGWATSAVRSWMDYFDLSSSIRSVSTTTTILRRGPQRLWSGLLNSSVVDDVVWRLITAVESVALVSMLGFFFLFCGCTI